MTLDRQRARDARDDDGPDARDDDGPDAPAGRPPEDRRLEAAGTAVALAILAVVAVVRLDGTALWVDEAYSLGAANHVADSLRQTSGTMGGYYAVLAAWSTVGTATWWLRLPSVLFSVASILLVRPVARRVGGSRLVAVSLPLLALNPAFAAKAVEARSYALVGLITVVCWRVVVRAVDAPEDERWRWIVLLAPLGVAGTLCHGLFLVQFAGVAVVLALLRRPVRSLVLLGAVSVPSVGIVLALRANGADSIGTTIVGGPGAMIGASLEDLLASPVLAKVLLTEVFVIGLVVAVQAVRKAADRTERAVAAVPAAWALAPCMALAAFVIDPVFNPRYLAPVAPGIAMVLGATAIAADGALARRRGRAAPAIGPAAVALALVCTASLLATPPVYDDHWRDAAAHVAAEAEPGDGIVFANLGTNEPVQQRPPFEAAWREVGGATTPTAISPARPLAEVRRMDEPLPLADLAEAAEGTDRIWVVENQVAATDQLGPVIEALGGDFAETERTTYPEAIVVVLLERR